MKVSKKQSEVIEAYKSNKYQLFFIAGGVGSAKTIGILALFDELCTNLPDIKIGCYRKTEKNLKQNLIPSYKKLLGYRNNPFVKFKNGGMTAVYPNGSTIVFSWADISKDLDCMNIKGGEYTIIFFNEADQIDRQYFEIAKTRVGRQNEIVTANGKGKLAPAIFCDMNPNGAWPKQFYDLYNDNKLPGNIFFQESLPTDNPFLDKAYFKMLDTLPDSEKKRYVDNDWGYSENPNQLITFEMLKPCLITRDQLADKQLHGKTVLGADIASDGGDKLAFSFLRNNVFYRYELHPRVNEIEATAFIKDRIIEHQVDLTSIDSIGVGEGTFHLLDNEGCYKLYRFKGGESAESREEFLTFRNKRSEAAWFFRQALLNQQIQVLENVQLQQELLAYEYKTDDKVISVSPKKDIKKKIHRSPDLADSAMMALYPVYEGSKGLANTASIESWLENPFSIPSTISISDRHMGEDYPELKLHPEIGIYADIDDSPDGANNDW